MTAPRAEFWLGGRDSNPDSQIQSLESYHWTTSQQRGTRIYVSRSNLSTTRILGPRLKVKLMLELQCIKMHNESVCSDFERLTFRKQRQLLYFQVPGETTERR